MATTRKTNEEKLQEIELKMEQLKNQRQALLKREQEKKRKERTRRLIQHGALAEKYLNCENVSTEQFEELLKKIANYEPIKKYLDNMSNSDTPTESHEE